MNGYGISGKQLELTEKTCFQWEKSKKKIAYTTLKIWHKWKNKLIPDISPLFHLHYTPTFPMTNQKNMLNGKRRGFTEQETFIKMDLPSPYYN